jgi:hypothetical protein
VDIQNTAMSGQYPRDASTKFSSDFLVEPFRADEETNTETGDRQTNEHESPDAAGHTRRRGQRLA